MTDSIFTGVVPATQDNGNATPITVTTGFYPLVDGTITHIRWYAPASPSPIAPTAALWRYETESAGTLLATKAAVSPSGGGWVQVALDAPIPVAANQKYVVGMRTQRYAATNNYFTAGDHVSGNLVGYGDIIGRNNGRFYDNDVNGPSYPIGNFQATSYFVDVVFAPTTVVAATTVDTYVPSPAPIGPSATVTLGATVGTPDGAVMPMLRALLAAYRGEAAKVASPPKYASIRPGVQFVAGQSTNGQGVVTADEACEGAIWVRVVNAYPTNNFPQQETGYDNVGPGSLAVVVELGVARCIPFQGDTDHDFPTSAQHVQATADILADYATMRRAYLRMREQGFDAIMGQYQPIPSESNMGGGTMHLTVRVPFCDQ